jgi:hypothetical protein
VGNFIYLKRVGDFGDKTNVKLRSVATYCLPHALFLFALVACNSPTSLTSSISTASTSGTSATRFASGTRAVKIITSDIATTGSFAVPTALPIATPIPSPFPGYDGVTTYRPGVSATQYFDVDGVTVIAQPTWLEDFQLGITNLPGTAGSCATFGGTGGADASGFYRTSEVNCGSVAGGTGNSLTDQAFVRIVLNRDVSLIGSAENLILQIEYQASSLRLNSDGNNTNPESDLDQLWKILWNSSLSSLSAANIFSVFVPPNYAACLPGGSGAIANGATTNCVPGYQGAPTTVKQIIIPISAYPSLSVIQLTRMGGRINNTDTFPNASPVNYVGSGFLGNVSDTDCQTDSPLCLGVVIRSVMLMRL